ncbi:ATP-binding protein [Roseobacter sp. YSTF-M11]|uniref:ATP-binding protein n=1 Tax=Roseobacter insulae TaxID=2859783 RepID=A0A9X1FYD9_9RHOB|nr:ATP-binding protein [Roseobacter insulae]MBW4709856.1 ATP-binding protein [Roseobacter insulae]
MPASDLVAIAIEGVSDSETNELNDASGEEVIDVAEYFGSEELSKCNKVTYLQLKHSTLNTGKPWVLGDLKKTLVGFYKRYHAFLSGIEDQEKQLVEFVFLTNRPVAKWVHTLLERVKSRKLLPSDTKKWQQIKRYLSADDEAAYDFLGHFSIADTTDGYWEQRSILHQELTGYLPGPDQDSADQLLLLVTKKALPESARNPSIRKEDVLRALKTDEEQLFPAPCLIEEADELLPREQEDEFVDAILSEPHDPIIIHAGGGVGKTAIARRVSNRLQDECEVVLYDCFGNGGYRSTISPRHRHEVACCQIANELAARGLCHPLIPSNLANAADYLRAFSRRLTQAMDVLAVDNAHAKIVIMIDAADNAQMAAQECDERTSFPRDLLRQSLPKGVVLVCLSRSHRVAEYLAPPLDCKTLELAPFSQAETKQFLNKTYPKASGHDLLEFHRLTSQNPRVQATALETTSSLSEALEALGPTATTVEDTIRQLFARSIATLRDQSPNAESAQIQLFCEALAALRPFVPIKVLSLASGLPEDAIKSFVVDIGRPLQIRSDAVQFIDEPSETWFRETYKPSRREMSDFVDKVMPLATSSSYVASALPQLLLEAGRYNDLVDMVLSEAALPQGTPAEMRQASLSRLQFALKAALRDKRLADAAKLSLKAGIETAGDDRQQQLFQDNVDLVAHFLSDDQVREIAANNGFSTSWHGGQRAYEAALLASNEGTISEARNTLRVAKRWLKAWAGLDPKAREKEEMSDGDIAALALASLKVAGAAAFVAELEGWTPKSVAYRAGLIVAEKLIDLGCYELLDEISKAAKDNLCILLAITRAQSKVQRFPPKDAVLRAFNGVVASPKRLKKFENQHDYRQPLLSIVRDVALAAAHHGVASRAAIATMLTKYIPDPSKTYFSNFSSEPKSTIISAQCLRAKLAGDNIKLEDLAKSEIREELAKDRQVHSREAREFLDEVGPVFRWHMLWASIQLGEANTHQLDDQIGLCIEDYNKNLEYRDRDRRHIAGEVSRLWVQVLSRIDDPAPCMSRFIEWKNGLKRQLFTPDLCLLARVCSSSNPLKGYAIDFAVEAAEILQNERMEAEQKVEGFCEIARSVFDLNPREANCYFDQAVEVAGRIGQEHLDYWKAILELSEQSATVDSPQSELAYRVSRGAEVAYEYVARDKYFDWEGTVEAITVLCPASSLAILSRWRDRDFGWQERVLPIALSKLVDMGEISHLGQLSTIGFDIHSRTPELLETALASCEGEHLLRRIFDETVKYALVSGVSSSHLSSFVKIGQSNGWPVEQLCAHLSVTKRREAKSDNNSVFAEAGERSGEKDWNRIFFGLQFDDPDTVTICYQRFRDSEPPYYLSTFSAQFFERISIGEEAVALKSLFLMKDISLYDVKGILEALPEDWKKLQSARRALREIIEEVCRTHFYEIAKSRYYQPLPFEFIAEVTGISTSEVFAFVVDESAKHPELFGSQRLLTLVGLIAIQISPQEAQDTLSYGLTLFEKEMNESDGDGAWRPELFPPSDAKTGLAGYLWSSLASPEATTRWRAAHVVCLLASFGETKVLGALGRLANAEQPNVFYDLSLPFYQHAAEQWVLIALRRALNAGHSIPQELVEFILGSCSPAVTHAIIRGFAAQCALLLNKNGIATLDEKEVARLQGINTSNFAPVSKQDTGTELTNQSKPLNEDDRYYFGLDLPQYWFSPLGRVFGISQKEIERRILNVIRNKWKSAATGAWVEDPRGKRGYYRDMKTHHSHGSYPRVESLSFYHAYHAMMEVAGALINELPVLENPDYDDRLEDWLQRHWITRSDGKWLADRRDPKPPSWPNWKDTEETDDWPTSVSKDVLLSQIEHQDFIPIWGSWREVSGDREQFVRISSALVSPERSGSLVRALQTATNPMDYRIPPAGDELEINAGAFRLQGWVATNSSSEGIDEYDSWAGVVHFPSIRPASWLCDEFDLSSDSECRVWHNRSDPDGVQFRSLTWGRKEREREFRTAETGSRLEIQREALLTCLERLDRELVFEVQVEREFRRDSYRNRERSIGTYMQPYTLILTMGSDGTFRTK